MFLYIKIENWITIIALIATIISSHYIVLIQIRKTKKSQWIDNLVNEISLFISLSTMTASGKHFIADKFLESTKSAMKIIFLLDEENKDQGNFINTIALIGHFLVQENTNSDIYIESYTKQIESIKILSKIVIKKELKKL